MESEGHEGSIYPRHFSEQILLTLAWMNTPEHAKREFLKVYRHLPHAVRHLSEKENDPWLDPKSELSRFTSQDFIQYSKDLKQEKVEY